jgi:hypothetical protein
MQWEKKSKDVLPLTRGSFLLSALITTFLFNVLIHFKEKNF